MYRLRQSINHVKVVVDRGTTAAKAYAGTLALQAAWPYYEPSETYIQMNTPPATFSISASVNLGEGGSTR